MGSESASTEGPPRPNTSNSEGPEQMPRKASFTSEDKNSTLASELEEMFAEDFKDAGLATNNAFQESLAAFHRKVNNDPSKTLRSLVGAEIEEIPRRTISYAQLLHTMTQGMVEMLSVRFGNLGCYQLNDPSARFYAVSLANDNTPCMFDSVITEDPNPLNEYDSHRTLQMIEVWFSVHPLSNIISKTLFLRNYKNNTHDPILLAVMLADASYVHEDDPARDKRESLFKWTVAQLRNRPSSECGLSTVQMLMLLGWHELCLSRARRATCYLGYAGRIVTKLQANLIQLPNTGHSQVNGVDVAEVEAELVRNMYWLTFSITLWSFMQIDQPYPQLLPSSMPTGYPPVDESSSAVVKLDVISDNVSTLAKQIGMIHELWPLSHIASTTAHIYALLPRKDDASGARQSESWQSQPIYQLRLLLNQNWTISTLCIKIRDILLTAVKVLEVKVENALSKALVLTAYHTTIIHLLFPRLGTAEDRVFVSEELLTDFCASSKCLLELFAVVDAEHDTDHPITRIRSSTFADVFVLGLDVCGRAIEYFCSCTQECSAVELENINRKALDLMSIASDMHSISKSETLLTAKNLRLVKKKLKKVKLHLHSASNPHGTARSTSSVDEIPTPLSQDMNMDGQLPDLFPAESNANLPEIWQGGKLPEANPVPYDMFTGGENPAFHQISWEDVANPYKQSNENIEALLGLQPNINNAPGAPPEMSANAQGPNDLITGQQGQTHSANPFGKEFPDLENVGMDMDFTNLGFFAAGDTWPSGSSRPAGGGGS